MTGGRRKCILRACPHHHYALDSIGGIRVVPLRFPTDDNHTREKWLNFVFKHNGTKEQLSKDHFLCSAHFLPRFILQPLQRGLEGSVEKSAVPTISPRAVRDLAIECGDMRPVKLDDFASNESPPVVFLEETTENESDIEHCSTFGTPRSRKRNHQGELSVNDSLRPQRSKVAFQLANSTLLKIWTGYGIKEEDQGDLDVMDGSEIQVVKKCNAICYNQGGKV